MHSKISSFLAATLVSAAPAALAQGLKAVNTSQSSWYFERVPAEFSLSLEAAEPELVVLQGAGQSESKAASSGSQFEVKKGQEASFDLGKCQVGDSLLLKVKDGPHLISKSKLSVKLTRAKASPSGAEQTEVSFHPEWGESDQVQATAKWEGNTLTLFGDSWVSIWN